MRKYLAGFIFCYLLIAVLPAFISCNKKFPNPIQPGPGAAANANTVNQKVLMIVIDGAVGTQVQVSNPPVLNSLVDYSIYSWDALSDYDNVNVTNALGWSNLLTGVKSAKHNVTGIDFSTNRFNNYPTLFTRIKQERPALRTAAFCSSSEVAANLTNSATESKSFSEDDAAVKNAVKTELTSKDPAFVFAQFHDVDKAGNTGGYVNTNTSYKDAVLRVDSYIGEILTSLKSRSSFTKENWLVIITSNKGSNTVYNPGGSWSAFDDSRHNTLYFCYNPRFNSKNPAKPGSLIPYAGTAPLYNGTMANNRRAKVNDGGTLYDIGSTGSYTIQCKVKIPSGSYSYPAFLSKRASFSGGVVGWVFFMETNYWQINFGQTGMGNRQIRGGVIADGQWHTLTAVIKQEGAARNVYTYTDGVLYTPVTTRDISSYGNLNSPQPLTVGNLPPDNVTGLKDFFITDIRFYNTALPDAFIAASYCGTSVDLTNPYYNNLVGFWPGFPVVNEGGQNKMKDLTSNGKDFILETYSPGSFNDLTTNVCPPVTEPIYKSVPNSVDVACQVYLWLGITVQSGWNLDGKNWIPTFSDVSGS